MSVRLRNDDGRESKADLVYPQKCKTNRRETNMYDHVKSEDRRLKFIAVRLCCGSCLLASAVAHLYKSAL